MNKKILFFDDEYEIAKILQKNLALLGHDVTLVSSISEFFNAILGNIQYDLLLMDIMAPVPPKERAYFTENQIKNLDDGYRAGEIIIDIIRNSESGSIMGETLVNYARGLKKYKDIPVLFYSARFMSRKFENSLYIRKPELTKTIDEAIKKLLKIQ